MFRPPIKQARVQRLLPQRYLDSIETAIDGVAIARFNELAGGLNRHELSLSIDEGLSIFDDLSKGHKPDYHNPFTAISYANWYQPIQIMLAYEAFKELFHRLPDQQTHQPSDDLRVIDFGCGQLAGAFGLALALADDGPSALRFEKIRYDSYDESRTMIEFGNQIWEAWEGSIAKDSNLRRIHDIALRFEHNDHAADDIPTDHVETQTWLIAMHVQYEENRRAVRETLSAIRRNVQPTAGVLTFSRWSRDLARQVSPFGYPYYSRSEIAGKVQTGYAALSKLSKYWRYLDTFEGSLRNRRWIRTMPPRWGRNNSDSFVWLFTRVSPDEDTPQNHSANNCNNGHQLRVRRPGSELPTGKCDVCDEWFIYRRGRWINKTIWI